VVFSVPSGNFGNLTAGLIAKRMGLPIKHFIASTNINDIVPEYLRTEEFKPRPSKPTISNAMDVGNPSNFSRMLNLYQNDFEKLKADISGFDFSDEETQKAMREVFDRKNYALDPHGAVGYLGLKKYLAENQHTAGVFLETAHPAKFLQIVEDILNISIELPDKLKAFIINEKHTITLENSFQSLKTLLNKILQVN
jgi:threonine synthase